MVGGRGMRIREPAEMSKPHDLIGWNVNRKLYKPHLVANEEKSPPVLLIVTLLELISR